MRLFPLLYLITKDLLDDLWIGLVPTAKIFNRKRHLNMAKSLVSLIEGIVGYRIKMKLYKRLLCFVAPKVLYKSIHNRALRRRYVSIYDHCRMFAEDSCLGHNNFHRPTRILHQETFQFISDQSVAKPSLELGTSFARRAGSRDHIVPNCLQRLQCARSVRFATLL